MSEAHRVLLCTRDETLAEEVGNRLEARGMSVALHGSPADVDEALRWDLIIHDEALGESPLLPSPTAPVPDEHPVILLGLGDNTRAAVRAMKNGAACYLARDEQGFLDRLPEASVDALEEAVGRRIAAQEKEDRANLDIQLRQYQKMNAVSRLAGGVAHEMNNILGSIMVLASYILARLEPEDPLLDKVKEALDACERGRDLTHNLLGFSRKGMYGEELLSANQAVEDVTDLLERIVPKTVKVEKDLADDLFAFRGDQAQIYHALMNICLNAAEAMNEVGTISITTEQLKLGPDDLRGHPHLSPGQFLALRIRDDGEGMNQETLERCFEPFFSTKPEQEGTGLGLAMVYGVMRNHGGLVTVTSNREVGTEFSLFFPKPDRDPTARIITKRRESVPPEGENTILFVDDERVFRDTWARLLRKRGFSVITAADGQQALEIFDEHPGEISLVILDLIMPVLDGLETFKRLREKDPNVRILMSTGFANEKITARLFETGITGFMTKPFDVETLMENVEMVLAQEG